MVAGEHSYGISRQQLEIDTLMQGRAFDAPGAYRNTVSDCTFARQQISDRPPFAEPAANSLCHQRALSAFPKDLVTIGTRAVCGGREYTNPMGPALPHATMNDVIGVTQR